MVQFIDLNTEVLIDRSQVPSPHVRLLLAAIGHEVVSGSPWVAVDKWLARAYGLLDGLFTTAAPKSS